MHFYCWQLERQLIVFFLTLSLDDSLKSIDPAKSSKWRKYLQIKKNIYLAYVCSFVCYSFFQIGILEMYQNIVVLDPIFTKPIKTRRVLKFRDYNILLKN